MYLPNFLDSFDRLVAFDAETTGKRTPDAAFIRKKGRCSWATRRSRSWRNGQSTKTL